VAVASLVGESCTNDNQQNEQYDDYRKVKVAVASTRVTHIFHHLYYKLIYIIQMFFKVKGQT
jgi:hypothetical protein